MRQRAIVFESTSPCENEEQAKTRIKQKRGGKVRTPVLKFDYEEETRSSTLEILSTTTQAGDHFDECVERVSVPGVSGKRK